MLGKMVRFELTTAYVQIPISINKSLTSSSFKEHRTHKSPMFWVRFLLRGLCAPTLSNQMVRNIVNIGTT